MGAASGIKLKTLPAVTVVTAGSAVPLSSSPLYVYGYIVISLSTNSGIQYLGDSTVSAANGLTFGPDNAMEFDAPERKGVDQFDLSKIYVDSSEDATEFRIAAWIRE